MSKVSSVMLQHPEWPRQVVVYRVVDGVTRGLLFECCMNAFGHAPKCSECSFCKASTASGRPCRQRACLDAEYCLRHLRERYNVIIRPSRIAGGGLGLFAVRPRPLRRHQGSRSSRTKHPVFVRGDFVAPYGGVRMTPEEFDQLYDFTYQRKKYENTGPYALQADNGDVIDGLCLRRVGAYANDYHGSSAPGPNVRLEQDGLWALQDIFPGEEILTDYGPAYWAEQNNIRVVQRPVRPDTTVRLSGPKGKVVRLDQ